MRILNKVQMKELMNQYPDGGVVFREVKEGCPCYDLLVTNGRFGAIEVIPHDGEVFDFDWNIEEYKNSDQFAVYENEDILQMVKTLTMGVQVKLRDWWED